MSIPEDPGVLARLVAGDDRVLGALRESFLPGLERTCARLLGDAGWAQEIAADIWMDFILDHVSGLKDPRAVPAYLRMMAVRRCRRLRHRHELHRAAIRADSPPDAERPDEALERKNEMEQLERCLRLLAPKLRTILRLRYHEDRTQEDIGTVFGFSKQYVGRSLKKGLEALHRCLGYGQ